MDEDLHRHRLKRLLRRLPSWLERFFNWLLHPGRRWLRIPAGGAFMVGGVFSFLPVLGLWMLPLGILLLAEDFVFFRRLSDRCLEWIERRHPNWMAPPEEPPEQPR